MKKRIVYIIMAFLAIVGNANAQYLTVASIEAKPGDQAELVVSANGMSRFTALQFNLSLPQGITLNENAITKGSAVSGHELVVETMANGERLFVLYNMELRKIGNGTLLKLPITIGQQSGTFSGSLTAIRTATTDAVSHDCFYAIFNVTVKTTVQPVTITADDKTMTYGDNVPTLTYKSSGAALKGTPKLSTTAKKTSPVGTYSIKVEKGTVTNEQVTYVDGTLTIEKAPLTVGVQNMTITEGDAIPSFTLTFSGFKNSDSESNAFTTKPKATTTATSTSKPGTYPITVSGGKATNYALNYTQGTLTILKKSVEPVTITADDKTMTYGDDVPTLTYRSSGAALKGTPKLSTTAKKTSPVGTYSIKVEKGTVTNEQVTYVDGTLTIEKAPLTVGVKNVTITEGDAIPSFTLTYSGFKNNDSEANAFTTKPKATTTATSTSKPGTYPITVSGGKATNYALNYTQGTLTILKKSVEPVTITADDKTMTYGDDVPTLTYSSSGAALNGTPKLSTTATKTSPVGTYSIKVEKGTVTNEQVNYVDGTLTIEKAPLTVGVLDVTITEGDAIPSFTLTYSGFKNSDTEANAFTTKPKATTTATEKSKPDTYPITVSGGKAKNYALNYTQGTLTILPATGIESVYADGQENGAIYNINGQKLSKPQKGINIINGKKVVVK